MSPRKFAVTMASRTVHGEDYGVPDVAAVIVGGHLFADVEVVEITPLPQGGGGCELCVVNGEVNGRPFLVCTEACGTPGEFPAADFPPGNVIEHSSAYWLGCAR